VLVSAPAGSAPQIDGQGSDLAWNAAPPLEIRVAGGANQPPVRVTARSVYTAERVYFLFAWADPTQSFLLNPWEKGPGGAWKQLTGADVYAEDQLALSWTQPDGGFMAVPPGQTADLWQWRSVQNVGQVDDLYLDGAGSHPDPGTGGYRLNASPDGQAPAYMPPGGGAKTGAPGYILDSEKVALNSQKFHPGDRMPSVIVAPLSGDRGDLTAAWRYASGTWTLEISRALVTGSPRDVQFSDRGKAYFFALAVFDNTLAHPAVQAGVTALRFQP
jgi:hypothetical protein